MIFEIGDKIPEIPTWSPMPGILQVPSSAHTAQHCKTWVELHWQTFQQAGAALGLCLGAAPRIEQDTALCQLMVGIR